MIFSIIFANFEHSCVYLKLYVTNLNHFFHLADLFLCRWTNQSQQTYHIQPGTNGKSSVPVWNSFENWDMVNLVKYGRASGTIRHLWLSKHWNLVSFGQLIIDSIHDENYPANSNSIVPKWKMQWTITICFVT